jgi:hypothetical protein
MSTYHLQNEAENHCREDGHTDIPRDMPRNE